MNRKRQKQRPRSQWTTAIMGILVILVIISAVLILTGNDAAVVNGEPNEANNDIDTDEWGVFFDDQYNFQIRYPEGWRAVNHANNPIFPAFNTYKDDEDVENEVFPLIHFSSATHLSFYPAGIPTEGVFGETRPAQTPLPIEAETAIEFILDDGTPWAIMITPADPPQSWEEWGFIWASAVIQNEVVRCFDAGEEISPERCDPLGNPDITIVREGSVDEFDWRVIETILSTLQFRS